MLGFYKNPPYIEERLREADVRSSIYLTVTVAGLEIWMLIRYMFKYVFTGKCATIGIFFKYTYGYWLLLISSVLLFVYSVLTIKGRLKKLKKYSRTFIFLFYLVGMYFGIATSLSDFSKGKMITCFLSMSLYVTFIFVVRPFISITLMAIIGTGFVMILNNFAFDANGNQLHLETGDLVNYIIFFISISVLYITIYFQRYSDAQKAYKLEMAAMTDPLTGVPNMVRLEQLSEDYIRARGGENKNTIYLVFNIRNLQTYNDRFSYKEGDVLIKELSEVIGRVFKGEPYARHSADKFMVLTVIDDYEKKSEQVRDMFKQLHPSETYLSVTVGSYRPTKPTDSPRHGMDCAQYAMKVAKSRGETFITEYDEKMMRDYSIRKYILNNLDIAVEREYIQAYYQPVIDTRTGELCGCEALARWIDPEKGFLSPGQFIPLLEESRQIHKLDKSIYENVLKNMRNMLDQGLPVLPTSLNFSRLDFELMDAVGELEKLIEKYNVPKKYIHVEVTESALTQNESVLHKAVDELHAKGYAIWLDDFGSGYSSMNVLKDYRFDLVKIDMVFLRGFSGNINSRIIIKNIIDLANKLHMETLAEGVETQEAVEFLNESGCDRLQGFYYGKPQTYDEILDKINDGTYKLAEELKNI